MPIVWHGAYEVDIGPHPFPTRKYRLVRDRLLAEGIIAPADLVEAAPASDDQVALVHTTDYLRKIKTGTLSVEEQLLLEVPFSPALREAAWITAGGHLAPGRRSGLSLSSFAFPQPAPRRTGRNIAEQTTTASPPIASINNGPARSRIRFGEC